MESNWRDSNIFSKSKFEINLFIKILFNIHSGKCEKFPSTNSPSPKFALFSSSRKQWFAGFMLMWQHRVQPYIFSWRDDFTSSPCAGLQFFQYEWFQENDNDPYLMRCFVFIGDCLLIITSASSRTQQNLNSGFSPSSRSTRLALGNSSVKYKQGFGCCGNTEKKCIFSSGERDLYIFLPCANCLRWSYDRWFQRNDTDPDVVPCLAFLGDYWSISTLALLVIWQGTKLSRNDQYRCFRFILCSVFPDELWIASVCNIVVECWGFCGCTEKNNIISPTCWSSWI